MPITRRALLQLGILTGIGTMISVPKASAALGGGTLDPAAIPKYVEPVAIPSAMPRASTVLERGLGHVDYYEIAVRQFQQRILPPGWPATTVWGYGSATDPASFSYPALTIEARVGRPVRVKWINDLTDRHGRFLPHLLAVDQTLHWANPAGGSGGRDTRPTFTRTPGPYRGPVPIVTHLHGGFSGQESDGYPEAWYLPAARNIPRAYATEGTWYRRFADDFFEKWGVAWEPGSAVFQYENEQRATTLWYHDHTLGMTRANVYAGPVGFYLLRGGEGDLGASVLPGGPVAVALHRDYEIPIAIQDRSFNRDGSLFYPDRRAFFDGFGGPYVPRTDVPPIWNPEFFGNAMVVNGRTWPFLEVEPRRYRFRLLNGCNSRFLILKLVTSPLAARPAPAALPFWQIGADEGFLRAPAQLDQLLMAPAERADVLVDLSGLAVGTEIYLVNEGPDEPFGGGTVGSDFAPADPSTTGQVMKLRVVPLAGPDPSVDPARLHLPSRRSLGPAREVRRLSLNEAGSTFPGFDGPVAAMLGTLDPGGSPLPLMWDDQLTESPAVGATEVWELHNFTEDAHPIHIHGVAFEVVDRRAFDGEAQPPESWETGLKDTVIAYPGAVTRVKTRFERPGLFVWHCHILEHEDNVMMRPYVVGRRPTP